MPRPKGFGDLIKLFLLMFIRSKIILILVLSISMPTAMATAMSLSTLLLHEQIKTMAELIEPRPSNVLTDVLYENCMDINIAYAYAIYDNRSFYVQIHVVKEFNRYIDSQGIKLIRNLSLQSDAISLGEALASRYRVDLGKPITICLSNQCYNLTVKAIHRGSDFFDYVIIANTDIAYDNDTTAYICSNNVNPALAGILYNVGRDTERFLDFLSRVIPISYMIIVFVATNKVINSYRGDIALMIGLGISRKKLMVCFTLVFILITCIFALYGTSLGVVFFHLSIWILRFIGVPVFVRPVPSISLVVSFFSIYIPIVVLSLVLAFMRLGEES